MPLLEVSSMISARNLRDKDLINLVPNEVPDSFTAACFPTPLSVTINTRASCCLLRVMVISGFSMDKKAYLQALVINSAVIKPMGIADYKSIFRSSTLHVN